METLRLSLNEKDLKTCGEILNSEGIVGIPTETVYGLAGSAYSDNAIKKIFKAKGRPQDNPLIVHISDIDMLFEVAKDVDERALKCAKAFWPGPFTMVLKKGGKIAKSVSAGLDTVAIRLPESKTARDIIKYAGIPLAAPSANTSGKPSPTSYKHVIDDLDGKIDAVVCGEECRVGVESTVVSIFTKKPKILRPGAVTFEQIKEILPDIEIDKAVLSHPDANEKIASPGMKYKHYAPNTELYLVEGTVEQYTDFVNNKADGVAICFDDDLPYLKVDGISYGNDDKQFAKNIFAVLRCLDKKSIKKGYVHAPSKKGVGLAVYNRLIRAAEFKVIKL